MRSAPRLRHVDGAWLLARDQRNTHVLPAQRLAHHQVAAHRTWGVSTGLEVMASGGDPHVFPGCAVDRCGRLLVLESVAWVPKATIPPFHIVLAREGPGPEAVVRVREPGRLRDLDVPLARVDDAGGIQRGDGERQWLHRPGPTVTLGGTVARGSMAGGDRSSWWCDVDLSRHRLADVPAVAVAAAGDPLAPWRSTFQVTQLEVSGFRIVVRHPASTKEFPSTQPVSTTPFALAWMAVLTAERPQLPIPEDW